MLKVLKQNYTSFQSCWSQFGKINGFNDPSGVSTIKTDSCKHSGTVLFCLTDSADGVKWFEKHKAMDIPFRHFAQDTAKGLGVGFGFFVFVVLIMMLFGLYRIDSIGTDSPMQIVSAFFLFLMVGTEEEIMFRGVLFRWIDEKWGYVAALTVSSVLFGFIHSFEPNATLWSSLAIAVEAGLLLGAAYKYSGTLWLPIGIHWAWNFTQGNIFGFEVSGKDAGAPLLNSTVSGADWLTGGDFGAEASVIPVSLGLLLSAWYTWKMRPCGSRPA